MLGSGLRVEHGCVVHAIVAPAPDAIQVEVGVSLRLNKEEPIVELAEASYPILKAQQAETFAPFQDKVGSLLLKKIKPEKLAKSIDLGLDALNSVPDEKVRALEAAVALKGCHQICISQQLIFQDHTVAMGFSTVAEPGTVF